jgi:ABC-2 type transport system permease protein
VNIYLWELKTWRKNTILWIVSLCAGTLFLFWMYPTFANNIAPLQEMLNRFPLALQLSLGLSVNSIGTVNGYYAFVITFLTLCGAVQAMMLGLSALGRETAGRTMDFLLTRPVTRSHVLTAKLLAALTCVAVTSAVYLAAASGVAYAFANGPFDYKPFLLISLTFFFEQVIFLALGLCVGAVASKIRSPLPVALSVVLAIFVIGMAASALDKPELYYLSPFKYFDALSILMTLTYPLNYALAGAVVTAGCVLGAYVAFIRRDMRA